MTLLLSIGFCGVVLLRNDFDPKAFVMEGTWFRDGNPRGTIGYDGQFAYYIALNPLNAKTQLDEPGYRYQRIFYPFLAWLLSFGGQPLALPWVMFLINVIALAATSGILAGLLEIHAVSGWYAVNYVLFLGVLMSLRADLNEILAILLALLGLLFTYKANWIPAGVFFSLAILTKDVALPFMLAAVVWLLIQRSFLPAVQVFGIGLLPGILWGSVVTAWVGTSPLSALDPPVEIIPFHGLVYASQSPMAPVIYLWVALPALLLGAVGVKDLVKSDGLLETLLLLGSVGLIAFTPRFVWMNAGGAVRVAVSLCAASLIYTSANRPKLLPWVASLWLVSGFISFLALI